MKSTIVRGHVFHQRFFPAVHRFQYPLYWYCLDLSELDTLDKTVPTFAHNRNGISTLHDRDYLNDRQGAIRDKLFTFLKQAGRGTGVHRVMLITSLRFFSPVFNPVSFYYCLKNNDTLDCVIVEVNNTFGERHLYILTPDMRIAGSSHRFTAPKSFHVSPFNAVEGNYEFYFGPLDRGIDIRITLHVAGKKKFIARLRGHHLPLTWRNHLKTCFRCLFIPHLTLSRIFKEAGVLYFKKKLPYVPKPVDTDPMTIGKRPSNSLQKLCMILFDRALNRIRTDFLAVTFPDGRTRTYGTPSSPMTADLQILDYDLFPKVVFGGDIGFGEAYMAGFFRTTDLANLLGVFIRAFSGNGRPGRLSAFFSGALARLIRAGEHNTLTGSRRNIRRHYDLSNDFFRLFLDESMTYSCALFQPGDTSLEQAQRRKIRYIIDKAQIRSHHHVLEIGSGWGSFAITAVRQTGCHVTTITLSREQYAHVTREVKRMGLEDRITVRFQDYRTMTGRFDRIVSIEMLEAVGHRYLGNFFRCCHSLLKSDGRIVLQTIAIPDREYAAYRLRLDWIQKHIFPGGHLPSLTALCHAMTKASPLIITHLEDIGPHYAVTLNHWYQRFSNHREQILKLGYDEIFIRKWAFYLNACEALFRHRGLEDLQIVLVRPYENSGV